MRWANDVRLWCEASRARRRVAVCILVPIGAVFTFCEYTVLSWIEWTRQWGQLLQEVQEFWKR